MDNLIGVIEVIFCIRLLLQHKNFKKKQGFSQFYPLALYCEKWPKMAKNGPKWPKMAQNGPKWPKMAIFTRGEDAYTLMYFDRHINGNKDGKILESNK